MARPGALILAMAGLVGGCRLAEPAPAPEPPPAPGRPLPQFPVVQPVRYSPDEQALPNPELATPPLLAADGTTFRAAAEREVQCLAAANTSTADMLDAEDSAAGGRPHGRGAENAASAALRRQMRFYTALELRNRSAGDALERFFQLADAEARTALLRDAVPVTDAMRDLARRAKAAGVRYPLDGDDADRQRSQLAAQLAQADASILVLNVDLRRRVALPWSNDERLWPAGGFEVASDLVNEDAAVAAAVADRPELKGLRALEAGLTAETMPAARDMLRSINPLIGGPVAAAQGMLMKMMACLMPPSASAEAEAAARRRQVHDVLVERERAVADEARAAAVLLNAQVRRIALARGRADGWRIKVEEARKERTANMPGSDLQMAQATLEHYKAQAEVVAEVMAWHQARVRLKAAQGRLAWECARRAPTRQARARHAGGNGTACSGGQAEARETPWKNSGYPGLFPRSSVTITS